MAATPLGALMFMGALATLATMGMLRDLGDDATRVVVTFVAAVVWGAFGLSSFDVIVVDSYAATRSEPIYALAYLGIALAVITGLFGVRMLLLLVRDEVSESDVEGMLQ